MDLKENEGFYVIFICEAFYLVLLMLPHSSHKIGGYTGI